MKHLILSKYINLKVIPDKGCHPNQSLQHSLNSLNLGRFSGYNILLTKHINLIIPDKGCHPNESLFKTLKLGHLLKYIKHSLRNKTRQLNSSTRQRLPSKQKPLTLIVLRIERNRETERKFREVKPRWWRTKLPEKINEKLQFKINKSFFFLLLLFIHNI